MVSVLRDDMHKTETGKRTDFQAVLARGNSRIKLSPCQMVVDTGWQFDCSGCGGVKRPSVPLNRQDLYVGLMTTFGSRTGAGAEAHTIAVQRETRG